VHKNCTDKLQSARADNSLIRSNLSDCKSERDGCVLTTLPSCQQDYSAQKTKADTCQVALSACETEVSINKVLTLL